MVQRSSCYFKTNYFIIALIFSNHGKILSSRICTFLNYLLFHKLCNREHLERKVTGPQHVVNTKGIRERICGCQSLLLSSNSYLFSTYFLIFLFLHYTKKLPNKFILQHIRWEDDCITKVINCLLFTRKFI